MNWIVRGRSTIRRSHHFFPFEQLKLDFDRKTNQSDPLGCHSPVGSFDLRGDCHDRLKEHRSHTSSPKGNDIEQKSKLFQQSPSFLFPINSLCDIIGFVHRPDWKRSPFYCYPGRSRSVFSLILMKIQITVPRFSFLLGCVCESRVFISRNGNSWILKKEGGEYRWQQ